MTEAPAVAPRRRFDPLPEWVHPATWLQHGGRRPERNAGAVVPPIYQTSTYHYPASFSEAAGSGDVHLYTRMDNPTQEVAAELIRGLEGAGGARVFASGMGACSTVLLAFLREGDEVVALHDLYGGTIDLLRDTLPRFGVTTRWVSPDESTDPTAAVSPKTRVVWLETPSSPLLRVHDIRSWAEAADRVGALLVVDNTFATPINQRPLSLGADLVVHSATKYLGGHSDLVAGAVVGSPQLLERVDPVHTTIGAALDPFAAFLLARGMRTLELRVGRQNANGLRVAAELAGHPKVERVYYPGSGPASEDETARRQMSGRGGVVSLVVRNGSEGAQRFLRQLRLVHVASSFGGVESLASVPAETSHRHLSSEELARRGIVPGLVRLSLGVEDADDLLRDLSEALAAV
ncbi:MAG: aminotransferase class I/II-fold pyridoxal phosphate-dependent enzyme [Thermoplasmata archaeon]|nr:aminotransferase class I/II-fold pyridoxal phosphate-dependent enzyme [Thermoplasmata archaeon]